jgi:transcriptional regulator with XRE-family HTH domain
MTSRRAKDGTSRSNTRGTGNTLRLILGRNIKIARERANLSQRDLCATTGISQSYLSRVEAGEWNIGIDNIAKIASAVGLAPHELLNPAHAKVIAPDKSLADPKKHDVL